MFHSHRLLLVMTVHLSEVASAMLSVVIVVDAVLSGVEVMCFVVVVCV